MADAMVLKTQEWLNATYGSNSGYITIEENGNTGWTTIYALRRALQIELGITATSSNFGPTTTAKFQERFPNGVIQQDANDETEDNIYAIIQGACWCKGYSTGASSITKHFYSGTGRAIKELKEDAGSSDTTSNVTLNVIKALLSMDQFKRVSSGITKIRTIQQELNNKYKAYIGLSPCDGVYGRQMNLALIKVLQAIEGYSVTTATGNFGSGTKENLPIVPADFGISSSTQEQAIKLIRYALCCNGYDVSITSGEWDSTLQEVMNEFQRDLCIEESEQCNTDTWMALLLSKGNPDRSCVACDTIAEMTANVLNYLKNNGYQIVGRYLTKVPGGLSKELKTGEAQRIINSGMKFFPIFQESGSDISYFTEARGKQDVKKAIKYARINGIPRGNIIYFAVDMDPTDPQISSYVLPYFKGVSENMGKAYKVGVYGTRNVCTQVMEEKYAETCFVSDMSTGFSGNMGFKMPENWNLDQFHEISDIVIGDETIDLDKVAYANKYKIVDDVYKYMSTYIDYIKDLEDCYVQYKGGTCTTEQIIFGITNFLRSFNYGNSLWYAATLTAIDQNFIDYIKTNNKELYDNLYEYACTNDEQNRALVDKIGGFIDVGHLAATVEGYISTTSIPDFWFGWGGDLASLMSQVDDEIPLLSNDFDGLAKKLLGDYSKFGSTDICTDADSIKIASLIKNATSNHPVSDTLRQYYSNYVELRISYYLMDLEGVNLEFSNLETVIKDKMTGVFENAVLLPFIGTLPTSGAINACCKAFAEYIIDNYPEI